MNKAHDLQLRLLLACFFLASCEQPATATLPVGPNPIFDSTTETVTPTPTESPIPTPTDTLSPTLPELEVETTIDIIECDCNGVSGKATVTLKFKNCEPPYYVNGQGPISGDTTTFDVNIGSSVPLIATSKDCKEWEDILIVSSQCDPPDECDEPPPPPPGQSDPPDPFDPCDYIPWC